MQPKLKAGASGPQITITVRTVADRTSAVVTVEGLHSDLEAASAADYVPSGYTLENSNLTPHGDGMATLTVNCTLYDDPAATGLTAIRTTFEVDMEEVTYDLEDHPALRDVRYICLKWLATDESKRVDGDTYQYTDAEIGGELPIADETAKKFCAAYQAGIKTFVRYYPVITKKSIWKNPPGLTMSGKSFTGGSLPFSADNGKFGTPPITLAGYAATNYFKGPEQWIQNENRTWSHIEKWTYTPDGSTGPHAWIYAEEEADGGDTGGDTQGGND